MDLIKSLSSRVEQEQIRKLQELSSSANTAPRSGRPDDVMSFGTVNGSSTSNGISDGNEDDFERLVSGGGGRDTGLQSIGRTGSMSGSNTLSSAQQSNNNAPVFSWSTTAPSTAMSQSQTLTPGTTSAAGGQAPGSRTVTPDLSGFAALTP